MSVTQQAYVAHSKLSKGQVSKLVARGMPLDNFAAADAWRRARACAPRKPPPAPELPRPPAAAEGIDPAKLAEEGPEAAFERQKAIEAAAYKMAMAAITAKSPDMGRLIQVHAQTAKNLTDGREQVLKLRELEQSLVSGAWVRKVMTEHDGAAVTLVRAMPKQLAGRLCPHDPEFAEAELSRWVDETFLKAMHETDPWKGGAK